jgi:hypothetical protein
MPTKRSEAIHTYIQAVGASPDSLRRLLTGVLNAPVSCDTIANLMLADDDHKRLRRLVDDLHPDPEDAEDVWDYAQQIAMLLSYRGYIEQQTTAIKNGDVHAAITSTRQLKDLGSPRMHGYFDELVAKIENHPQGTPVDDVLAYADLLNSYLLQQLELGLDTDADGTPPTPVTEPPQAPDNCLTYLDLALTNGNDPLGKMVTFWTRCGAYNSMNTALMLMHQWGADIHELLGLLYCMASPARRTEMKIAVDELFGSDVDWDSILRTANDLARERALEGVARAVRVVDTDMARTELTILRDTASDAKRPHWQLLIDALENRVLDDDFMNRVEELAEAP